MKRRTQSRPKKKIGSKYIAKRRGELNALLGQLDPLLDTLTLDDWNAIPTAAEALAWRGGGARAVVIPRPPQPVEVVLARVGREIVGALLLRRSSMERWDNESA